ncbi:Eukaryotic translation initiation factor 3 subunit E [Meloidogyne graminicola]|uniref:Eukaryotic translation initiation factor 3 subunit E n=1 Tax=Meloidogyne graminicola TaxID=189291 RepID=A0A8S9ZKG7_9BILA|nr:Eukaryotic translation initiation factor 3 subunit E [Meloidogyne graminicola]
MKDLIKVIDVERYNYQDPVTEFLSCLYIDFDFDAAQTKLRECESAEAERWIVNLIRNYRIDGAKIDSQSGQVVMSARPISIHEQVMENTKRMTIRSQQIALQLEKSKIDKKVFLFLKKGIKLIFLFNFFLIGGIFPYFLVFVRNKI